MQALRELTVAGVLTIAVLAVGSPFAFGQTGSGGTGTGGGSPGKGGTQQSQEMMHKERMKEQQEGKEPPQGLSSSTKEDEKMPKKGKK